MELLIIFNLFYLHFYILHCDDAEHIGVVTELQPAAASITWCSAVPSPVLRDTAVAPLQRHTRAIRAAVAVVGRQDHKRRPE